MNQSPFQLKDDVVTIPCSWQSAKEATDWIVTGPAPDLKGGAVVISAGSSLTHKLKFASKFDVKGELALGNREGKHFGSSGGFTSEVENSNGWFVSLMFNGTRYARDMFDKDINGPSDPNRYFQFALSQANGVVSFTWDKVKLGHAHAQPFGSMVLTGGNGGDKFWNVVISGVLDADWAREALSEKEREKEKRKQPVGRKARTSHAPAPIPPAPMRSVPRIQIRETAGCCWASWFHLALLVSGRSPLRIR